MPCFSVGDRQRTDIPESYKPHFDALAGFLRLPWWKRIWIVQEMALPDSVKLIYSSEEISYEVLQSAVKVLNTHAGACCKEVRTSLRAEAFDPLLAIQEQVDPLVSIREAQAQQLQTTLLQLRRQFHASKATEVVDLFYGLLGLVTTWSSTPLVPDYKAEPRKAIAEAVSTCFSDKGGMEILMGQRTVNESRKFPSWIPDACCISTESQWVTIEERRLTMSSSFSASGTHMQDTQLLTVADDETLRLQTKFVDTIDKVGPVCNALEDWQDAPDVLRNWMEMVGLGAGGWPSEPPDPGTQGDIFWRTIMNNSIETDNKECLTYRSATQDDYSDLHSLWNFLLLVSQFSPHLGITEPLKLDLSSHDKLQIKGSATIYHVIVCLLQRRLFVTNRGMIGLASGEMKTGDEVHIILGCQTPFILRPSDEASKTWDLPLYTVIGNGYVHQVMYGEAFDDPELGTVQAIVLE
ncbi:hypothetical protein FANTH_10168 [Fusarium anthophilum]|uniref:Heterokaryon incompatibility domain-containing protein n=1 Tax=Fusarium anthophilum TaxID=48485 RepID=A0A8H4Z3Y9_9HYPO|nr:hypothetical protein FANTH_10168 [Fusarium anthophilum]